MSFERLLTEALDQYQPITCPQCGTSMAQLPTDPVDCKQCGYKDGAGQMEPGRDSGHNPEFIVGDRYSERARMRTQFNVPGINAGQVGSGVAD
jgi:hypothetical protein